MSASSVARRSWVKAAAVVILVMVALSPVAAWAAGVVNYAEPLENAAKAVGAADAARTIYSGLLPAYTVPGLGTYVGTLVSGLVGVVVVFLVAVAIGRALE
jgi:cobalt/nickel transport protein